MSQQSLDPDVFRFLNEIGIINQLARHLIERKLPHGLKISQFALLNHFVRLGGAWSPTRLANAFQVTKGAMTNTVRRLDSLGFVAIVRAEGDGRSKRVGISEAGKVAHQACLAAMAPDLAKLQQQFGATSFKKVVPFLEELRIYLDQERN